MADPSGWLLIAPYSTQNIYQQAMHLLGLPHPRFQRFLFGGSVVEFDTRTLYYFWGVRRP